MTELDKKLQNLATTDWKQFMEVVGENAMLVAKARILRKDGKSYHQISIRLEVTEAKVRHAVNKNKADKI